MIDIAEVLARGITLPDDAGTQQDIIDEQADWLMHRIGQLFGERTETFYVGLSETRDKLYLRRYTDAVEMTDGGVDVDTLHVRLVEDGSAVQRTYSALTRLWSGPYVEATYTPNDEGSVRRVLFDLVALRAEPIGTFESEQIGSYSYRRGTNGDMTGTRAALASSILPVRRAVFTVNTGSRKAGWQ